jgi:predicted ArsR family transcriptional regulator
MDAMSSPELNIVLHQPVRTRIVAYLVARGESTFNELKQALDITDGNLDSHMKKLISAGYVETKKQPAKKGKQQTLYSLTEGGSREFENYIETLKCLLSPQFIRTSPQDE